MADPLDSSHSEGSAAAPRTAKAADGALDGVASSRKSGPLRALRPVLSALGAAFVLYAGWDLWTSWGEGTQVVQFRPLELALAWVCASAAMVVQLVAWRHLMLRMTGRAMPGAASAALYLDSQMARYMPGKVGLLVVRIAGARDVGVDPKVMGGALLVETLSWCGVGTCAGALALGAFGKQAALPPILSSAALLVGAGAALGVVALLFLRARSLPLRMRALLGDRDGALMPPLLPALHALHYGAWIASGAFVARGVGADVDAALAIGGLLCVAIVAGFIAFLAPAGAGVREALLAWGAAPLVGPTVALTIGIVARAISLSSDVALFFWFRFRARKSG